MIIRHLVAGVLGAAIFLVGSSTRADDVFSLGLPASGGAPTLKLGQAPVDAETLEARGWCRPAFRGGFYRSHWGGGFYGGGFYRSHWGGGFCGPRYYGSFYRGGFCGSPVIYSGYSYCYPRYYCGWGNGFCPISDDGQSAPVFSLALTPSQSPAPTQSVETRPQQPAPVFGGPAEVNPYLNAQTFPYNGGPKVPVAQPLAPTPSAPSIQPSPSVPMDGRAVSMPGRSAPRYSYPAYGEQARPSNYATDATVRNVSR